MENGTDLHFIEMQSELTSHTLKLILEHFLCSQTYCFVLGFFVFFIGDANRQISEYKFKLSKAEQEIGTMEQNVSS